MVTFACVIANASTLRRMGCSSTRHREEKNIAHPGSAVDISPVDVLVGLALVIVLFGVCRIRALRCELSRVIKAYRAGQRGADIPADSRATRKIRSSECDGSVRHRPTRT